MIVGYGRQRHAIPSVSLHPLKGRGGEGPSSRFLVIQIPRSSVVFHGSRHATPVFRAPADFAIPPVLQGFPTIFWDPAHFLNFRVSPPILVWRPLSARSGCLPRSGFPPRSVHHPRSVRHPRSVHRPTSVCPSPDLGLSITRPPSVRHPPSVCPSPALIPGRFCA